MRSIALLAAFAPLIGHANVRWPDVLRQEAPWYASAEAQSVADAVLQYQTEAGGWPKNTDMTASPSAEFLAHTEPDHRAPTMDNGATTTQLELLARVASASGDLRYVTAINRGIEYLLSAQSASGGWPQYYPLRSGYYSHITYNDDATVNVLKVLNHVAAGEPPFANIDAGRRHRAADAVNRGIACILATQIREEGRLTVWCAQHDEVTLAPVAARTFEPASFSACESTGIVRFLMTLKNPTPAVIASVEAAADWLEQHSISGLRVESYVTAEGKRDRRTVADPSAPRLWARFYELSTSRPIFCGRDRVVHYDFNEIERERRAGYAYLGTWPEALLKNDYPQWREASLAAHTP
jgi:PelA/Pel-15E family pectate lyase